MITRVIKGFILEMAMVQRLASPPERLTPDRKPFRLKHKYKEAGTYTVRAIWTDSTGASNFRDLTLVVTPRHVPKGPRTARFHRP